MPLATWLSWLDIPYGQHESVTDFSGYEKHDREQAVHEQPTNLSFLVFSAKRAPQANLLQGKHLIKIETNPWFVCRLPFHVLFQNMSDS